MLLYLAHGLKENFEWTLPASRHQPNLNACMADQCNCLRIEIRNL